MKNILRAIWQFCSFLFVPQKRPKAMYKRKSLMEDIDKTVMELLVRANTNRDMAACQL